jgi:hypothetical protein
MGMKTANQLPASQPKRFDSATYEAAVRKELDATQLLLALESSRAVACGVISVLSLLRDQHSTQCDGESTARGIGAAHADELLTFCIESMELLNVRIETVADFMAVRNDVGAG